MKRSAQPRPRRIFAGRSGVAAALAGAVIVAAAVAAAGASALAAPHVARGNFRGPARPSHAVVIKHDSNYKGPARPAGAGQMHGSNLPSAVQRHVDTQNGSE